MRRDRQPYVHPNQRATYVKEPDGRISVLLPHGGQSREWRLHSQASDRADRAVFRGGLVGFAFGSALHRRWLMAYDGAGG